MSCVASPCAAAGGAASCGWRGRLPSGLRGPAEQRGSRASSRAPWCCQAATSSAAELATATTRRAAATAGQAATAVPAAGRRSRRWGGGRATTRRGCAGSRWCARPGPGRARPTWPPRSSWPPRTSRLAGSSTWAAWPLGSMRPYPSRPPCHCRRPRQRPRLGPPGQECPGGTAAVRAAGVAQPTHLLGDSLQWAPGMRHSRSGCYSDQSRRSPDLEDKSCKWHACALKRTPETMCCLAIWQSRP